MSKSPYTLEEQIAIKKLIYDGVSPADIVARFPLISLNAIAQAKRGAQWTKAPWPDGTTGPMAAHKADANKNQRAYESHINPGYLMKGTMPYYNSVAQEVVDNYRRSQNPKLLEEVGGAAVAFERVRARMMEDDRIEEERIKKEYEEAMARSKIRQTAHEMMLMERYPGFDPKDPSTNHLIPMPHRPQDMPINADIMNKVDWEEVERRFGEVPIVVEALASEDPDLKTAIRIMATIILPDSSQFEMSVRSMMRKVKAWQAAKNVQHLVVIK